MKRDKIDFSGNGKSRGESPARLRSPVALWFGLKRKSDKRKRRTEDFFSLFDGERKRKKERKKERR